MSEVNELVGVVGDEGNSKHDSVGKGEGDSGDVGNVRDDGCDVQRLVSVDTDCTSDYVSWRREKGEQNRPEFLCPEAYTEPPQSPVFTSRDHSSAVMGY